MRTDHMEMSNSWDWSKVSEKDYWNQPSAESYYFAEKWKREGRKKLLDLGCGLGRHSLLFARYGFQVTAMDTSEEAVRAVKELSSADGLDIRCDVMDMHEMHYPDGSFDCVFAYLSVSHTDSEGIRRIISEIRRVLAPSGELFFTLCSKDTWSFINGKVRKDDNTIIKTEGAEKGLPHYYVDKDDIVSLMEGFRLLNVRHIDDCYYQGNWRNSKHYFIEASKI